MKKFRNISDLDFKKWHFTNS